MKQYKVFLIGILGILLVTFIGFAPIKANAATITNGQNIKLEKSGKQFYKFTLEDDALVQLIWDDFRGNGVACNIYRDKNKLNYATEMIFYAGSGKTFRVMPKGTYYVDMYDNNKNPTTSIKFNWTPLSKYDKGNYSKKTAEALKADTIEHVAQVGKYSYARWYKIKVSKEKILTIKTPYGNNGTSYYGGISLLNAKSQIIKLDYSNKEIVTTNAVPAGTYYIVVNSAWPGYYLGEYVAFKWK